MKLHAPIVHIHYHRLPDHKEVFHQHLVLDDPEVRVTLAAVTPIHSPLVIRGRRILEPGSPVVWFTFPGAWHDIGRFHLWDGTFTGVYCNILTPPIFHTRLVWETTDLFLDLWMPPGDRPLLLDEGQFLEATERGWLVGETAETARREAYRLIERARTGDWPPSMVREWTLARATRSVQR